MCVRFVTPQAILEKKFTLIPDGFVTFRIHYFVYMWTITYIEWYFTIFRLHTFSWLSCGGLWIWFNILHGFKFFSFNWNVFNFKTSSVLGWSVKPWRLKVKIIFAQIKDKLSFVLWFQYREFLFHIKIPKILAYRTKSELISAKQFF